MKKIVFLIILHIWTQASNAQTPEDSVKAVINKLFTAMKSSDAKSLAECFADSAILQTITRTGKIRNEVVKEFISQIGSLPKDSADERIVFDMVKVDDALAIAWTPYQFYFAGKFSHCGVNSFQLVRFNGVWKIQYLIDTRRKVCASIPVPAQRN
ncbi:MAG: nuclear transport factor 2 family protein [Flavisolibacter sp.]|nr:nuclear transport factor 2 family protein [Flavisolibacter sp.]